MTKIERGEEMREEAVKVVNDYHSAMDNRGNPLWEGESTLVNREQVGAAIRRLP